MSVLLDNISDLEGTAQALDYISRYDVTPEAMSYFRRNPDVAKAYATESYGYDPSSFASAHFALHGEGEGRVWDPRQPRQADIARQEELARSLPGMTQEAQQEALQQAYGNIGTPVKNTDDRYGGEGEGAPFFEAAGLNFLEPTETGFRGPVSGVFDQPGPGGQYGQYMGTFSPSGQLQDVEWTKQERPSNFEKYGSLIPGAIAALAGIPTGFETLASAAAGTPELVIGGGPFAGAAPTASLTSLSTAAAAVEGAGEMFMTDLATANNVVNTVANNPVMTAIADATPQALESMAANAGTSFNVPGVSEAVSNFSQTINQATDFGRNLWNNIGETLVPNASPQVQRVVGEVALRTAATNGDFEQALKDTGLSFITGGIGGGIAEATGSPLAGRIAADTAQQLARTGTVDPGRLIAGEASRFFGEQARQATDSSLIGDIARSTSRDLLTGRDPTTGLINIGTGALLNQAESTLDRFLPTFGQTSAAEETTQAPIEARTAPPSTIAESVFGRPTDGIGMRDVTAAYIANQLQQQGTGGPRNVAQPPPGVTPTGNRPPAQVDISTLQRVGPSGAAPTGAPPVTTTPTGQAAPTGQIQTGQGNITQAATPITGAASLSDILATMRT